MSSSTSFLVIQEVRARVLGWANCMLRNAFVRHAFEGNCLALKPMFAGVHSSVSNWERYSVSSHRLHQHGDTKAALYSPLMLCQRLWETCPGAVYSAPLKQNPNFGD